MRYAQGPGSVQQPGVPVGRTVEFEWHDSSVYPGTSRKFWVHVPARYDPSEPASLMLFQDGQRYLDPDGEVRGGVVLDSLVHHGDIPVTIGVFVDPGVVTSATDPKNHNVEYDAFDDRYVMFLLTEIIPHVTRRYSITDDPAGGASAEEAAVATAPSPPPGFAPTCSAASSAACPASRRCRTATPTPD